MHAIAREESMIPQITLRLLLSIVKVFKNWKSLAPSGCTGAKIYAPGSQNVHTGCNLSFEH